MVKCRTLRRPVKDNCSPYSCNPTDEEILGCRKFKCMETEYPYKCIGEKRLEQTKAKSKEQYSS
jgi:hypothetical protein